MNEISSVKVHVQALLNISDHITRILARYNDPAKPFIFGLMLGVKTSNEDGSQLVEVKHSIELAVREPGKQRDVNYDGSAQRVPEVDCTFFRDRQLQMRQVHPDCAPVGIYITTDKQEVDHVDRAIYSALKSSGLDSPDLIMLHVSYSFAKERRKARSRGAEQLPVSAYQILTASDGDTDPKSTFRRIEFSTAMDEVEWAAIEHISRNASKAADLPVSRAAAAAAADPEQPSISMDIAVAGSLVIDHKSTEPAPCSAQVTVQTDIQRGAYEILAEHLRILAKYVTDVINGNAPEDHEILHDIYTICCNMPVLDERDERFHELMLQQKTDVMLAEYLSLLTEQLDVVNSMIYKSNVIIEQATKKDRGGRIGDLFGTDIKGRFEGKVGMSRMSMRNIK